MVRFWELNLLVSSPLTVAALAPRARQWEVNGGQHLRGMAVGAALVLAVAFSLIARTARWTASQWPPGVTDHLMAYPGARPESVIYDGVLNQMTANAIAFLGLSMILVSLLGRMVGIVASWLTALALIALQSLPGVSRMVPLWSRSDMDHPVNEPEALWMVALCLVVGPVVLWVRTTRPPLWRLPG